MLERKKLLQKVAHEKVSIVIKNAKQQVFIFKTMGIDSQNSLHGSIVTEGLSHNEKVTALFYIDKDRYFLTTTLKHVEGKVFSLLNDTQFFKFNRRAAFRVVLGGKVEMNLQVVTIRNMEVKRKLQVMEFSSGGAQIKWSGTTRLAPGTVIKGILQWKRGKFIPVDCSVIHNRGEGIYGIRFVNLTPSLVNRLKMLSVEVQQTIYA